MKKIFLLTMIIIVSYAQLAAQATKKPSKSTAQQPTPKLENNVRQYFFVMLTKGPNRDHDSATAASIQEGHMANINRLYSAES